MIDYAAYGLDFSKFNLTPGQFDQQSHIHGIAHSYRVMLHCLRLGVLSNSMKEAKTAFFGAYIHDMARLHDGYCTIHGADSAKIKLPLYRDLFISHGASLEDIDTIKQIVTRHSIHNEPSKEHKIYCTLAILKDADALDRIRLGKHDLNPDFLRIGITHQSIPFGEDLFYATNNNEVRSFVQMIEIANELD